MELAALYLWGAVSLSVRSILPSSSLVIHLPYLTCKSLSKPKVSVSLGTLFAEKIPWGHITHRGWQFTGSSLNGGSSWVKKRASWEKGGS